MTSCSRRIISRLLFVMYIAVVDVKPYASDMECFVPLMEKYHGNPYRAVNFKEDEHHRFIKCTLFYPQNQ